MIESAYPKLLWINKKQKSSLIKNDSLLLSNFDIDWDFNNSNLSTSFKMYQDLTRVYSDRYQYIYPDYKFIKRIDIPENYNGKFDFSSYGFNKNYNTNITESVLINNVLFKSDVYIRLKILPSSFIELASIIPARTP